MVISTYSKGRLSYLLDCIESVKKQSLKPREIILVLDPDTDLVEFYNSRIASNMKIGVGEGCGLSKAGTRTMKAKEKL